MNLTKNTDIFRDERL